MCRRECLVRVLSALVHFLAQVYGDDSACLVNLGVQKHITHYSLPGSSLQLHCTVSYCAGRNPKLSWCKLAGNECLPVPEEPGRLSTSWRVESKATRLGQFVLTFVSLQPKDTGAYRCLSKDLINRTSVSRNVHVNVTDGFPTESPKYTITTQEHVPTNTQWLVYVFAALGTLCLIAITLGFLWCIRLHRSREKHKKPNDDLDAGTTGVIGSAPSRSPGVFTSADNVLYSSNCGSMAALPQDQPKETVYDNEKRRPRRTNPNGSATANHSSASNSNRSLPAHDGVVVYAAINHSTTGGRINRELSDSQAQLTEYAVICVRK